MANHGLRWFNLVRSSRTSKNLIVGASSGPGGNDDRWRSELPNSYITEKEAALYLGLERHTLTRWRWANKGPRFYRVGAAIRYKIADLEAYTQPQGGKA